MLDRTLIQPSIDASFNYAQITGVVIHKTIRIDYSIDLYRFIIFSIQVEEPRTPGPLRSICDLLTGEIYGVVYHRLIADREFEMAELVLYGRGNGIKTRLHGPPRTRMGTLLYLQLTRGVTVVGIRRSTSFRPIIGTFSRPHNVYNSHV